MVYNKFSSKKYSKWFMLAIVFISTCLFINENIYGQSTWTAPASANSLKNPLKNDKAATEAGKTLYKQFCAICHGNKGKGDGIAGMSLKPRPANFLKDAFLKQTDGAVYWKLTEGKAPMASYKNVFTDKQRWQLVNYITSLKK